MSEFARQEDRFKPRERMLTAAEELVKSDWRTLREHVREYNAGHPDKPHLPFAMLFRSTKFEQDWLLFDAHNLEW